MLRFPVTGLLIAVSIGVSLAFWSHRNIDALVPDVYHLSRQPWRMVTDMFPHVNVLHLVFNLMWLWRFGQVLEGTFGWVKYAGLVIFLALGSSAAEWTFLDGGVGLSGVIYGFFGLLWVLSKHDPRFARAMDQHDYALAVKHFSKAIARFR